MTLIRTLVLLLVSVAAATAHDLSQDLLPAAPGELWEVTNSQVKVGADGVYRWQLQAGQSAELAIKADHELLSRLRYYDYATFEVRIASGSISGINFDLMGHVSGPRQYKVHNFQVAILTTEKEQWHRRCFELSRPNWFPWDNKDGQVTDSFLKLHGIALEPGTVVELRGMSLTRGIIRLKPDFLVPITWPVLSRDKDGNAVYTLQHHVVNQANRPLDISAETISEHSKFGVVISPEKVENVKNGKTAVFTVTATLPVADEAALEELYTELLALRFTPMDAPEAALTWQGELVRPLGKGVRRQVLLSPEDLALLREKLATDEALRKLMKPEAAIKGADEFVGKELLHIPTGHAHVRNNWVGNWRPGERMPEIIDTKTGDKQYGTDLAGRTWKEYMGHRGKALEHMADAYLYTGDETYAKQAIALFSLYAQQYTELTWDDLFSPSFTTGEAILASSRMSLSSTYGTNWYFKGHSRLLSAIADSPSWDDETREAVYTGFVLPYATEVMKFAGGISNMTDISNHNILLMGLAFGDATLVRWALYSDPGLLRRLRDIKPDGFSSEGRPLNYHYAAMAEYLPALNYLDLSQLPIDFPKERLATALKMPYQRANLAGYVPLTGDNGRGVRVGSRGEADWLVGMFPDQQWLFDIGRQSTVQAKLRAYRTGKSPDGKAWQSLLETTPRLFEGAGYAILRSGKTAEEQVMVTLDYGSNPMHAHLDRNTISLSAFGNLYTNGPGSLYNVGRGGMTRNTHLDKTISSGSLAQNVILVDQQNQDPAVGTQRAWQVGGERQVVSGHVPAIRPGVDHTRTVVLEQGIVVLIDQVRSDTEHTYDFVYHNFGSLSLGTGWSGTPVAEPLGKTANYENLIEPQALTGSGPIQLNWKVADDAHLALWQLPVGQAYTAMTGLNNLQTKQIPGEAPAIIHRATGKAVTYLTVLEPYRDQPRVTSIKALGNDGLSIALADGKTLTVAVAELLNSDR